MGTITIDGLEVPGTAPSLEAFREWVAGLDEHGPRVHFSRGNMHFEMRGPSRRAGGPLAQAINVSLERLATELDLGEYWLPPAWITCPSTELSAAPDGFLVSWQSYRDGVVRVNPERPTEWIGRPDMALAVVSPSSVEKDLHDLVEDYAAAGVRECWIADARSGPVELRILALGRSGAHRDQVAGRGGWIASPLWERSFRIEQFTNRVGLTRFRLLSRDRPKGR